MISNAPYVEEKSENVNGEIECRNLLAYLCLKISCIKLWQQLTLFLYNRTSFLDSIVKNGIKRVTY